MREDIHIQKRTVGENMSLRLRHSSIVSRSGLTLFEMMIVVTVTLILSLIFIYSAQHIVVRTKIERVKEEQRVLSRALQNYRMDYNDYPRDLHALNAPTAYLSTLPPDPFLDRAHRRAYVYYYEPAEGYKYIIVSAGPDGDLDLNLMIQEYLRIASSSDDEEEQDFNPTRDEILNSVIPVYLAAKVYDPTNGIISDGDVVTFSHQ